MTNDPSEDLGFTRQTRVEDTAQKVAESEPINMFTVRQPFPDGSTVEITVSGWPTKDHALIALALLSVDEVAEAMTKEGL